MIEWIGNMYDLDLRINNKLIGMLQEYDDFGQDCGWSFTWKYGSMEYDSDTEYFSASNNKINSEELENVKKKVLVMVKDVLGHEYLELKHLYETLEKYN